MKLKLQNEIEIARSDATALVYHTVRTPDADNRPSLRSGRLSDVAPEGGNF